MPKITDKHKQVNIDDIQIGDWFWIIDDKEGSTDLWCVRKIGSNYVGFTRENHRSTSTWRISFDEVETDCIPEKNWKEYFKERMSEDQKQIEEKTKQLILIGQGLHILNEASSEPQNLLPSTIVSDPSKYKQDLVTFRDKTKPTIQEEIKNLTNNFTVSAKNAALTNRVKLERLSSALEKVDDRIFTIELYAGISETVKQIAKGSPAKIDEPICIRQLMLFMDEECLVDYNSGGLDFENLNGFDRWIAKAKNRDRILPEKRGIVAFRVRRNNKDYGPSNSFHEMIMKVLKNMENYKTYLLIRNGYNLYRIATPLDFSPRLVPFRDEIGEKQFTVVTRGEYDHDWNGPGFKRKPDTVEKITKDNLRFDDHVEEMDSLIKKYNRIFILIQGILDRSDIFAPHPGIRLNLQEHMDKFIYCIRDEEDSLPSKIVTFEEYRDQLNKTLRKNNWVYSNFRRRYDWYDGRDKYETNYEAQLRGRPAVCQVSSIKRDRSQVRITWERDVWDWKAQKEKMNQHLYIPIKEVFNLSSYNRDDYKMFLCDRTLRGEYLKWAPQLLTAEDMLMKGEL